MARPRSRHVLEVKAALAARLNNAIVHPGGRFLSTRSVAERFGVSYQTAHRLLAELHDEGMLRRVPASGSYVPGLRPALRGVQLIFHARARRRESFGAHLLQRLEDALVQQRVPVEHSWIRRGASLRLREDHYPVIWEEPSAVEAAVRARRFAMLLNNRPPVGLGGAYIDAVTADDFSGGACAAELLKQRTGHETGFAVLGGPVDDARSVQRIAGFREHAGIKITRHAKSWFVEGGRAKAAEILAANPVGIFACNDRLAEAVLAVCSARRLPPPPLVGFDNAPIAERLRLTTIGIPWGAMVAEAVRVIRERLQGSLASARLICLSHEPVMRLTA